MKRQLFFALFIVIFSAVALSQVSKKSVQDLSKVEKEVNEVIHQRLDALRRGDAKAYASYFGDDCIITGDKDLLVLMQHGGINIFSPRDFLMNEEVY